MTDLLLAIIILVLLFQTHSKEKNVGKYGRLCVFLEKRTPGYLITQGRGTYHKVKCRITISKNRVYWFIYKWTTLIKEHRR